MDNHQVRARLMALPFSDFDAFCLDYFSATRSVFSEGMDRIQRISSLLERHGAAAIFEAYQRHSSGNVELRFLPIFQVPQPLSIHFTGREDTLVVLRQQLSAHGVVSLWGMGGIGKTQMAVAYAYRHRQNYPVVLSVPGDSASRFEQGLLDAGRLLLRSTRLKNDSLQEQDIAAMKRATLDYLREASDYLLICDNLDSPDELKDVWPGRAVFGGHVLITSRSQTSKKLAGNLIEIDKLSLENSMQYLSSYHPAESINEQKALIALAQELDGLPLALSQAAGFLSEHQSRYSDYLKQYRKERLMLLEEGLAEDYPRSVATTWSMNIKQIGQSNQISLELLKLCAVLHPDAIPEELFIGKFINIDELSDAADQKKGAEERDALALDRLVKPLLGYKLMRRDRENRMLSLHRLVQQAVVYQLPNVEQRHWIQTAVAQIDRILPAGEFPDYSNMQRRFMSQMTAVSEHIQRFNLIELGAAHLLTQEAFLRGDRDKHEEAEALYRLALHIREEILGKENAQVACSLGAVGTVLRLQGKIAEAEEFLRRSLMLFEKLYNEDHIDAFLTIVNLATLLHDQDKQEESELLISRAQTLDEKQRLKERQV